MFRIESWVRALLLIFAVSSAIELAAPYEAEARAGRGRSAGRSSSYGSRRAAPNSHRNQNQPRDMNQNRGSLLRSMAGGLAGGFLGSMLFSSFGNAAGIGGRAGGGGIGLLEIILIAGLAYFGFRWWKRRQPETAPAFGGAGMVRAYDSGMTRDPVNYGQSKASAPEGVNPDEASDIFFRIQGAWTRRNLSSVRSALGSEIQEILDKDLEELKRNRQINRLENISIRRTDVTNTWQENDCDYSTVRFMANLLDYTVDENSGQIVEGSDSEPVKFEEDWIFAKPANANSWQLVGIQQV